jgi:hypothetical protein
MDASQPNKVYNQSMALGAKQQATRITDKDAVTFLRRRSKPVASVQPTRIQRAGISPQLLSPNESLQLQRTLGNRVMRQLLPLNVAVSRAPDMLQRLALEDHALNDDPEPSPLARNCYTAVLTWLLRAHHNVTTTNEAINIIIDKGHAGPLVQQMLGMSTKLTRPSKTDTQLTVTPGKIIIFARNGAPAHAAVATGRLQITGYNQTHWFGQPANVHSHSSLEGVNWVDKDKIHNSLGHAENVYEVDPAVAATLFN